MPGRQVTRVAATGDHGRSLARVEIDRDDFAATRNAQSLVAHDRHEQSSAAGQRLRLGEPSLTRFGIDCRHRFGRATAGRHALNTVEVREVDEPVVCPTREGGETLYRCDLFRRPARGRNPIKITRHFEADPFPVGGKEWLARSAGVGNGRSERLIEVAHTQQTGWPILRGGVGETPAVGRNGERPPDRARELCDWP